LPHSSSENTLTATEQVVDIIKHSLTTTRTQPVPTPANPTYNRINL